MGREEQIISERIRKINELRDSGINPYPTKFEKKHFAGKLQEKFSKLKKEESSSGKVKIAGRLLTKRDLGKIAFSTLQDCSGRIQIVLQESKTPSETFELFKKYVDAGDFVGIEGSVFRTKRGELSILAKEVSLLSKSILPLPEKFHGLQDKEERYRKRYVDLIMNPEVKEIFDKRSKIINAIREFLVGKEYVEVDTPILQPIYGGTSAKPFKTELNALKMNLYLRISNELYLKRLIAGGYEKIFEFSKDFRNEGIDVTHNPEFTLMETMCAYADYKDNMEIVEEMIEYVVKKIHGGTKIEYQGKVIDFKRPWKRMTLVNAIQKYGKISVGELSEKELKEKLSEIGLEIPVFTRGRAIEAIFSELVESKLIQPTIIYDYPFETCGLAKPKEDNPEFAERFEPYVNGWEIGNVYSELNNPDLLEQYWNEQEKLVKRDDESQRMDLDFINMLRVGMPPTSGVGIGVDRLVMLLTNSASIRDVILFPFMKTHEKEKFKN